jgi:DNA primase
MESALPLPPSPEPERSPVPRAPASDSPVRSSIDRIKHDVQIAELVGRYVKLQNLGHSLVGLCPFHEDHHPSLPVFPVTATFHCFGCCKHGDVITFIREIEHLSFRKALDRLQIEVSLLGRRRRLEKRSE